ncbi:MAG: oxidoreductase [Hyphomicrobiales bacterium]|jgi:vanillate O-demethylase ferredoxin subunit|nr:oxidoreductase [Hyphomicrobiales bacterium]
MRYALHWGEARISAIRDVSRDIREFTIVPESGARPYAPGSHLNVGVIIDGQPDHRSYSLVGTGDGSCYRIAVRRHDDSRGGSRYMWTLREGARLSVTDPHNLFTLEFGRPEYLLLAGGIGVTPLIAMAAALNRSHANWRMIYAAKSRADAAFLDELAALHSERIETRFSDEGHRLDLAAEIAKLAHGAQLYLCGPLRLLDAARAQWSAAGRPQADLRFETFASGGLYAPELFRVKIPRLGIDLDVPPDRSMLDVLESAGIEVMADCRRGECGLCALDVIAVDGEIDHRDVFLSDHEKQNNEKICTCVSRVVGGSVTVDTAYRPSKVA